MLFQATFEANFVESFGFSTVFSAFELSFDLLQHFSRQILAYRPSPMLFEANFSFFLSTQHFFKENFDFPTVSGAF